MSFAWCLDPLKVEPVTSSQPPRTGPQRTPRAASSPVPDVAAAKTADKAGARPDEAGQQEAVPEKVVSEQAVPEKTVPEMAGPEKAGPEKAGPEKAQPGKGGSAKSSIGRASIGRTAGAQVTAVRTIVGTAVRTGVRAGHSRFKVAGTTKTNEAVGRAFGRLTVLPVICVVAWLVTGLPLLLAGEFLPVPVLLISAPLATAVAVNVMPRTPGWWPAELPGQARDRGWMPWFGLFGSGFVAGGFVGWQFAKISPSVIVTRTPGAYFQTGYWIAQHGSLPIPGSLSAFGGAHPGLHLSSIGFFASGHSVVPAVSAGLPMLLAGGFWTSGVGGGAFVGPVLGGLAIFTFGGLVGRLAGRQWAPAGALVLAVTAPELYTSRDAFSEPVVQVLLFGGLCLVLDALTASSGQSPVAVVKAAVAPLRRMADDQVSQTLRLAESVIGGKAPEPTAESAGSAGSNGVSAANGSIWTRGVKGGPGGPGGPGAPGSPRAREAAELDELDQADTELTTPIPAIRGDRPGQAGWAGQYFGRLLAQVRGVSWRELFSDVAAEVLGEPLLAGIGGLALGLTSLLTLGALVYLIPVIAVAGILVMARRAIGAAFCIGLLVGCGYGLIAGYVLARPFADSVSAILRVVVLDAGGVAVATAIVILWLRVASVRKVVRKALARRPLRWLPGLTSLIVVAALVALLARPYFQKVRGAFSRAEADYVAYLQQLAHLKVDPTRLYSEDTLYWVIWYAGLATVILGGFGAALLVRRCVRVLFSWQDTSGATLNWALPAAIVLGGSAAILWQPFTVPDQPWASRRLVPVVIPGLILLATWAAAWLSRRARARGAGVITATFVSFLCVAAMAVPAVATSFGLGLSHSGTGGGLRPSAGGLAQRAVGVGETAAVRDLCGFLGQSSSVVILDRHVAADFTQVIRGMCGVPVAWMPQGSHASAIDAVLSGIAKAGRRPVVLGAKEAEVSGYGGSPTMVMNLDTTQDPHELTEAPGAPWSARYVIWMAVDDSPAVGI